jgi:hypothetical protein
MRETRQLYIADEIYAVVIYPKESTLFSFYIQLISLKVDHAFLFAKSSLLDFQIPFAPFAISYLPS